MLNLSTSDEFAAWFRALDDTDAEEVASALELIETLGPERAAPGSRELLLWYQAEAGNHVVDAFYDADFFRFATRVGSIIKHIESARLLDRLPGLPAEDVRRVAAALRSIQADSHWRRLLLLRYDLKASERASAALEASYRTVLEALDATEPALPAHSDALREINLRQRTPGMRILYGVDAPNRRALLLVGEPLDRRAYGSSVRRALACWQRYLAGEAQPETSLPLRTSGT
jgi:hypothetical protein